jgi:hypothetical protein
LHRARLTASKSSSRRSARTCSKTRRVAAGHAWLHQQAVLAGAKALVALEFLHDDDKASRNNAAFENHIRRMEDKDDQLRGDDRGGTIQPVTALQDAAFGRC